jgi:starch synthase
MNCMQAGLRLATKVIAVSQGYAWEITTDMGGWGLAPLLREFGEGACCISQTQAHCLPLQD